MNRMTEPRKAPGNGSRKRILICCALALLLLACISSALALEAADLTERCKYDLNGLSNAKNIMDRKYTTYWESKATVSPQVVITAPEPVYGLYLCFRAKPRSYEIQADRGSGWETVCEGHPEFLHVYYELDGAEKIRICTSEEGKTTIGFNEVAVFGEGRVPEWVQRWEEVPEKTDLMFVVAHPDEEAIFLGGAIPVYAVEREHSAAVVTLTYGNPSRRSEFLNSLWSMGYRSYPIIGSFKDGKAKDAKAAFKTAGQDKVLSFVTEAIRRCKPEVMVTLDENGEGKNGQRMMTAEACRQCFDLAGNENTDKDTAALYGTWQPQKLYLHLYGDDRTVMDWEAPLESRNGISGMGAAYYAYLYYKTQDASELTVYGTGKKYESNSFGLCKSLVGEDRERNDFLENIPEDRLTPAPRKADNAAEEEIAALLPELNDKGFLDEGEFVYSDDDHGIYLFVNKGWKIIIRRRFDGGLPLTWFETRLWCDTEAGELIQNFEVDPAKKSKARADAAETARNHKLVFAANGDYYNYRMGSKNGHPVGIEIRNGEIYFDTRYSYDETEFFPNLDTLAFYQDGRVDVHHSFEVSAEEYLAQQAYMVFSFGPYLIRNGQLSEWVLDAGKTKAKNPRHSFGMVEPGYYVDIMCEGRLGSRSEGVTMPQMALISQAAGLQECCNLDGGQTCVVIFMGHQLNKIGKYDGKTNARPTCEVFGGAFSDQVGSYELK